jgi:hypothetical protein
VSKIVGMLLHTALLKAGHDEWHTVTTQFDMMRDDILVRFDSGTKPDGKLVQFNIPAHLFDPVEYAQAKWPKWFVDKSIEETT